MKIQTVALVLATFSSSNAFRPLKGSVQRQGHRLHITKDEERHLRRDLESKNSIVEDESRYSVHDGADMQGVFLQDAAKFKDPLKHNREPKSLTSMMDRMTKPRAYPLFLAEKTAEFFEAAIPLLGKAGIGKPKGTKEKIVVLGTGWGAASFLKSIDTDLFDVTVISPRNYFLFTPMLAGASVGTVEFRSITEPIREINRDANFLEALATSIDTTTKTISCESVVCSGNECNIADFTVNYDRLIFSIGAQTNTFGIPGVREHCCFLKQVEDARRIRTNIVNCFERANIPSLTDKERYNNLCFAVIGAGPTGVEFAAELRDFIEEDGPKYYPDLLQFVRIMVIEASSTVLAPFDKTLQDEAIKQFKKKVNIADPDARNLLPMNFELTELLLDSAVKEVTEKIITLQDGREINYGLAVWAAGNGPLPLSLQLIDSLGEAQAAEQKVARGRLAVDPWMRVIGSDGNIMAFGDCTCMTHGQLPATAQVASQQGEYLAGVMNKNYNMSPEYSVDGIFPPPTRDPDRIVTSVSEAIAGFATQSEDFAKPFQFLNLGILAYTGGGTALSQVSLIPDAPDCKIRGSGEFGNAVWKSVYLSKQVSWRNRVLVLNDWTKRRLFGRDITRL